MVNIDDDQICSTSRTIPLTMALTFWLKRTSTPMAPSSDTSPSPSIISSMRLILLRISTILPRRSTTSARSLPTSPSPPCSYSFSLCPSTMRLYTLATNPETVCRHASNFSSSIFLSTTFCLSCSFSSFSCRFSSLQRYILRRCSSSADTLDSNYCWNFSISFSSNSYSRCSAASTCMGGASSSDGTC